MKSDAASLYVKGYDLLLWLARFVEKLPRMQRLLRGWHEAIGAWLASERGLTLKPRPDGLRSCQAWIEYLGYEVSREGHRPAPKLFWRLRQRLERLTRRGLNVARQLKLKRCLESYAALVAF